MALLKVTDTTYAVTIAANLYQEVQVLRSPPMKTFGVTWDAGVHVGAVSTEQLASLRHRIGALVDQLVADYQAANRPEK